MGLISILTLNDSEELKSKIVKDVAEKTLEHVVAYPATSTLIGGAIILGSKAFYDTIQEYSQIDEKVSLLLNKITLIEKIKFINNPSIDAISIIRNTFNEHSQYVTQITHEVNTISDLNTNIETYIKNEPTTAIDTKMKQAAVLLKETQQLLATKQEYINTSYINTSYINTIFNPNLLIEKITSKNYNNYMENLTKLPKGLVGIQEKLQLKKNLMLTNNDNITQKINQIKGGSKKGVIAVTTGVVVAASVYSEIFTKGHAFDKNKNE